MAKETKAQQLHPNANQGNKGWEHGLTQDREQFQCPHGETVTEGRVQAGRLRESGGAPSVAVRSTMVAASVSSSRWPRSTGHAELVAR